MKSSKTKESMVLLQTMLHFKELILLMENTLAFQRSTEEPLKAFSKLGMKTCFPFSNIASTLFTTDRMS